MRRFFLFVRFVFPSFLSIILLRLLGFKIGKNVKINPFCLIIAKKIEIGNDSEVRSFVLIKCNEFVIGSNTIVSYGTQIKGDAGVFTKDNCFFGIHSIIHCDENVYLGFYSSIGVKCLVYTHSSFLPYHKGYPLKFEKVTIGDFVWMGIGVCVLAGSEIGSNVILGPGVVVNSKVPDHTILEMNPSSYKKLTKENYQDLFKPSPGDYLNKFVNDFIQYYNFERIESLEKVGFKVNGGLYFYSIEVLQECLNITHDNIDWKYDFKNYYCSESKNKIHLLFLFFLRRRFAITLRTDYKS